MNLFDTNGDRNKFIKKIRLSPKGVTRERPDGGNRGNFQIGKLEFFDKNQQEDKDDREQDDYGFLGQAWLKIIRKDEGFDRYPSMKEVIDGIIHEEHLNLEQNPRLQGKQQRLLRAKENKRIQWEMFVKISGIKRMEWNIQVDVNTNKILDPNVKKCIMMMYSLESFLYKELNRACRKRDKSKVKSLGPFAFVMQNILGGFNPTINVGKEFVFENRT